MTKPSVKYGSDLKVGDVIRSIGQDYSVTAITPYPNPHLFEFMDDRWTIAHSGDWGMTIDPDHLWAQLDNRVWVAAHHYPFDVDLGLPLLRTSPKPAGTAEVAR